MPLGGGGGVCYFSGRTLWLVSCGKCCSENFFHETFDPSHQIDGEEIIFGKNIKTGENSEVFSWLKFRILMFTYEVADTLLMHIWSFTTQLFLWHLATHPLLTPQLPTLQVKPRRWSHDANPFERAFPVRTCVESGMLPSDGEMCHRGKMLCYLGMLQ